MLRPSRLTAALLPVLAFAFSTLLIAGDLALPAKNIFPADNPWNRDISRDPVDPNSAALVKSIGLEKPLHPDFGTTYRGAPNGIPFVVVGGNQPRVPVQFQYKDESDPGPYPIPADAPIEGGPAGKGREALLIQLLHAASFLVNPRALFLHRRLLALKSGDLTFVLFVALSQNVDLFGQRVCSRQEAIFFAGEQLRDPATPDH